MNGLYVQNPCPCEFPALGNFLKSNSDPLGNFFGANLGGGGGGCTQLDLTETLQIK